MTNETNIKDPGDEREALIPWYVTGKLSDQERRSVEEFLAENPGARHQLELAREELDQTIAANEQIKAPSARMLDALMAGIEAQEGPDVQRSSMLERMLGALTAFMPAASPSGLRLAALAAALVICVQGAAIGWMVIKDLRPGAGFETASRGTQSTSLAPRALIGFNDQVTSARIVSFLSEAGVTIVDGPKPGALFVVRLGPDAMSDADAARVLQALKARTDIVRFASQVR